MLLRITLPVVIFGIIATDVWAEISEKELGPFRQLDNGQSPMPGNKNVEGDIAEIKGTRSFEKWKTFQDDRVKFDYPDHDEIHIEVKHYEPAKVDGERASSADSWYGRTYRVTAKNEDLTTLILNEAEWLDDSICLCGQVVYERYLVRRGNLYRFSFLRSANLKKMQVLGDGERIMMFEWTHSHLAQPVYRRIARSVELKRAGPWKQADCRKRVLDLYGPKGSVGWLDEGSPVGSAEELLGPPSRSEANGLRVWEFPEADDGYRWTDRILLPLVDGKLARFDSGYRVSGWNEREVIEGSTAWMLEAVEPSEGSPFREDDAKKLSEDLKQQLLALFWEKRHCDAHEFNTLCQVLRILVEQGVRDDRALDLVRTRFAAEGGHYAAWVLHEAEDPESVNLFVGGIREIYGEAAAEPDRSFTLSDLHNWMAFIPEDDRRYPGLLREGLTSPNASVREISYFFLNSAPFPSDQRLKFVRNGLRDSSSGVRNWSAGYYERKNMSADDWALLRRVASIESDEQALGKMNEMLNFHRPKSGPTLLEEPEE